MCDKQIETKPGSYIRTFIRPHTRRSAILCPWSVMRENHKLIFDYY